MDEFDEFGILTRITNISQTGGHRVVQILDHFEVQGSGGKHACFVLELLGPTLYSLQKIGGQRNRIPMPLLKHIASDILTGLVFLHDYCRVIHTGESFIAQEVIILNEKKKIQDLKPDNIMAEFSEFNILEPGITIQDPPLLSLRFKIADFGHGV
jgi:serine/threonine protein kinase